MTFPLRLYENFSSKIKLQIHIFSQLAVLCATEETISFGLLLFPEHPDFIDQLFGYHKDTV